MRTYTIQHWLVGSIALLAIVSSHAMAETAVETGTTDKAGSPVVSAPTPIASQASPPPTEPPMSAPMTEVMVSAPEPRYVAPTLRDRIGRIWAPVYIDGKGPFRLVLDTGANSSAILESVAKSLGKPIEQSNKLQLHGATGKAQVPFITVESLEVGDLLLGQSRLPIVADVFGGAEGILGSPGLVDKRIFIDFKNDIIRITRSRKEGAPSGFVTVPLKFARFQLPTFDIYIGNIKTKAILDTGAQQTAGNSALRQALLKRANSGTTQEMIGVTLDIAYGQMIKAPTVDVMGVEIRNLYVAFSDMYIFEHWQLTREPTIIVGMDMIGLLDRVIIDYRQREMYLRARHP